MKTKALLFSALCLASAGFVQAADEDVTPAHFNFAAQEVGNYEFVHYSATGSNPTQPYPADKLKVDGTVVLSGGQVKNDDATQIANFNKGCHIVSSEYGNMLLIKGTESQEQPDVTSMPAINGYLVLNMYTTSDFPALTPVRFQFVSKVITGETPISGAYKMSIVCAGGSAYPMASVETYTSIDTKWWPIIKDLDESVIGGSDQVPLRMKWEIPANYLNKSQAIYIASLKFTANPSEPCPEFDPVMFDGWDTPTGDNTSTVINAVETQKGFVAWDNQNIYLNEMEMGTQVYIYSLNGSLVKTVTVLDSFVEVPMSQGAYVVKYGNKATKVIL